MKKFLTMATAAITLMMTAAAALTACTNDDNPGEDPVKAELCAEKAQMIALFYDYIQANHATAYQTRWGEWKRQFNDK